MPAPRPVDEGLLPYATPRQAQVLRAIAEHGSQRAAARELGVNAAFISRSVAAVEAKAARHGYAPDHDLTNPAPPGYMVKGTSTLYDKASGEARLQWVKTTADKAAQEAAFRAAVAAMVEEIPPAAPVVAPSATQEHLCVAYPVGDHHFGMLAWGEETGSDDYDLQYGEQLLMGATSHLVETAPPAERGVIVLLGDFLHHDSLESVTPTSGHQLDADSRYPKMVRAAIRTVRWMVRKALERHAEVLLIVVAGNHDLASMVFLREALHALYDGESRVIVDRSPRHFHYFTHGSCLVGVHHGHGVKLQDLPLLMATECPAEWGGSAYRYWYTGHVHHDQVKDFNGCRVESFRILPPVDAFAANKGYRTGRDMKAVVLHRQYGEVARHIVNPAMLEAA